MASAFRIVRPDSALVKAERLTGQDDFKFYLDRLLKMIPAEVLSLYVVGSGLIPPGEPLVLAIWAAVCLVGVICLRAYGTADPANSKPVDWIHVMISSVAFVIWVYTLGGPFIEYGLHVAYIGSLLVLAWTFFVPIFYKGPLD